MPGPSSPHAALAPPPRLLAAENSETIGGLILAFRPAQPGLLQVKRYAIQECAFKLREICI